MVKMASCDGYRIMEDIQCFYSTFTDVLTCHFWLLNAIFALRFRPILTKVFLCPKSNNLRKCGMTASI